MRKILLLFPEYYQKSTCNKTINTKTNPMTTILGMGQAHETCGVVELVWMVPNETPSTSGQRKDLRHQQTNHKIQKYTFITLISQVTLEKVPTEDKSEI